MSTQTVGDVLEQQRSGQIDLPLTQTTTQGGRTINRISKEDVMGQLNATPVSPVQISQAAQSGAPSTPTQDPRDRGIDEATARIQESKRLEFEKPENRVTQREDFQSDESAIAAQLRQINEQNQVEFSKAASILDQMASKSDEKFNAQVERVKQVYAQRIADQERINKATLGGQRKLGFRSGRARNAPEHQKSLLAAEESAGIARVARLNNEMNDLIFEAEEAKDARDFQLFNQRMNLFKEKQKEAKDTLLQLNSLAVQEEERALQRSRHRREDQEFELKLEQFYDETSQRAVPFMADYLVDLDSSGNIIEPTFNEIEQIARSSNVDPLQLNSAIQSRVANLRALDSEQRLQQIAQTKGLLDVEERRLDLERKTELLPLEIQQKLYNIEKQQVDIDRVRFLNKREAELLPLELQIKRQILNKGQLEIGEIFLDQANRESSARDASLGILGEKQITSLEKSPQFKNLKSLQTLKTSLVAYKSLVEEYGTAKFSATQKRLLQGALADARIAWKEAAELGALTGPDLALLDQAIPPATSEPGFVSSLLGIPFGPTLNTPILKALDRSIGKVNSDASQNVSELSSRSPREFNSDYVYAVLKPFSDIDLPTMDFSYDSFVKTANEQEVADFVSQMQGIGLDVNNPEEAKEAYSIYKGFSQDLGTSENFLDNFGGVTAFGSPLWEHGLDLDLKVGDPIPSPISGKVTFVGSNKGFGKQVKVKAADGNSYWFSHLDDFNVKKGDTIQSGQVIGKGGKTGRTIPGPGGDGSHLDLTVQMPNGSFMSPREIFNKLA